MQMMYMKLACTALVSALLGQAAVAAEECTPSPMSTPTAPYPQELIRKEVVGTVHFEFRVLPGGTVVDVHVTKAPDRRLANLVVPTVEQWKFAPHACGDHAGVRIRSYMTFKVE